jgi:hypothetical protein
MSDVSCQADAVRCASRARTCRSSSLRDQMRRNGETGIALLPHLRHEMEGGSCWGVAMPGLEARD